jgi:pumilio family protein 6
MSGKKDATKSEGQSRKRTPSRVKDIDSHHKKSKHGANSLSVGPKKVEAGGNTKVMSKKERNELTKQRKARSQKNFDLIQQAVADWEKLRHHDTPSETRSQMVTMLLKKLDGRVAELAGSHSASRVVQACIKYGKASDREIVFKQVEPKLLELSKSPYGRFVVSKLISVAPKKSIPGKYHDATCVNGQR